MEAEIRKNIKRFNALKNGSGKLVLTKDVKTKLYTLAIQRKGEKVTSSNVIKTAFLGELDGIVVGLIIANDYEFFGHSVRNPFYRYFPTPMANHKNNAFIAKFANCKTVVETNSAKCSCGGEQCDEQ